MDFLNICIVESCVHRMSGLWTTRWCKSSSCVIFWVRYLDVINSLFIHLCPFSPKQPFTYQRPPPSIQPSKPNNSHCELKLFFFSTEQKLQIPMFHIKCINSWRVCLLFAEESNTHITSHSCTILENVSQFFTPCFTHYSTCRKNVDCYTNPKKRGNNE